jgi:hypothetical protein
LTDGKRRPQVLWLEELEPRVTPTLTTPILAATFANSIGVNTHFLQGDSRYDNGYTQLKADLQALGIVHVRDQFVNYGAGSTQFNDVLDLAAAGIKHETTEYTDTPANNMASLLAPIARAIEGVEGINEPENFEPTLTAQDIFNYQQALYNNLKGSSTFANTAVLAPSLVSSSMATALDPSSSYPITNYSDYANPHSYPFDEQPPESSGSIQYSLNSVARVAVPNKTT